MASFADVEVRHLVALRAVAEQGSFGRAAVRLGYSQAAISQQIAGLERAIGVPVFDRPGGPRPVELTPVGRLLVDHARTVIESLARAEREIASLLDGSSGRVSLGAFQSISVQLLPSIVARMRREAPGVQIDVRESADDGELTTLLLEGDIDLCFLAAPIIAPEIEAVELLTDPYLLLVPPETPGKPKDVWEVSALDGAPMIDQPCGNCGIVVADHLRANGAVPRQVFISADNGAVQAMVRAGLGSALMPRLAVDLHDPMLTTRKLNPPVPPRVICLATRKDRTLSPAANHMRQIVLDVVRDFA